MIVERLGQMNRVEEGGWFVAIPFVDRIKYVIDMRETAMTIKPQGCITKDNVSVHVSGTLYYRFLDAKVAAYGSDDPLRAVINHAQSSMRAAIGEELSMQL